MNTNEHFHPILDCGRAAELEASVLPDEASEWAAMERAGHAVGVGALRDYREIRALPERIRVLALVGKGHNGGDALLACATILDRFPEARVCVLLACGVDELKPLTGKAYERVREQVETREVAADATADQVRALLEASGGRRGFDLCLDGLLGMAFRPPVRAPARAILEAVNGFSPIRSRAAVDVPSGRGDRSDEIFFKADFTYATGIAKTVLFEGGEAPCGRVRYLDLGFFDEGPGTGVESSDFVMTDRILDPLRTLRPASSDKRLFGHIYIVGGSAYMPGAMLMAVQAAVHSGAGLVTAFAPASVASILSAQVPEAMWIPWPESPNGTLSPRATPLLFDRINRATAVLVGPGMGSDWNTELVTQEVVRSAEIPVVLDADALRARVVELAPNRKASMGPVIVTPHLGEFARISKTEADAFSREVLLEFCRRYRLVTVLKGPLTKICDGEHLLQNTFGGPVLSRGGSGDVLAGLIGGMVAQAPGDSFSAVARGVALHGRGAQEMARDRGQVAVRTTWLLDYLPRALRGEEDRDCAPEAEGGGTL